MRSTSPTVRPGRPRALATLWSEVAWPVLTGSATAAGLVELGATCGWLTVGAFFLSLAIIMSLAVFAAFPESEIGPARAGRVGATAALGTVVIVGLTLLSPLGGWAVAAAIALTWPRALVGLRALRDARRHDVSVSTVQAALDQAAVDAVFDELVAELDTSGEGPDAG
jgi:hypothetical protein